MILRTFILPFFLLFSLAGPAAALDPSVLESVVRLKPDWSPAARGVSPGGAPRDPEGTGIAIFSGGFIATNVHVIGDATRVDVMLFDGRRVPAEVIGRHPPSDIALLRIDVDLPVLTPAGPLGLADPVCAIGNQFGLGQSVTCGVVSAPRRSGTGFNPIEDFIQTDAVVNPGGSGGALVTRDGALAGMISAIFTKQSDADIGVNFAASLRLVTRVTEDLREFGEVRRVRAGFRAGPVPPPLDARVGGVMVRRVEQDSAAFQAGLDAGDVVTHVAGRQIHDASHFEAEIFMVRPGESRALRILRGEQVVEINILFNETSK